MDQAQRLREIIESSSNSNTTKSDSRIIAVASGKGGVGKTNFTVNLGISLARMGKRVSIIDADLGLSNVDVLMGIAPKLNLSDFIKGDYPISEIIVKGPHDINVISGGSGMENLANITDSELEKLIMSLSYFNTISDYILIDTAAGLGKTVLSFVAMASELVVVITPDPTSITDAYSLIKNVVKQDETKSIKLVINRVESEVEAHEVFNKLEQATKRFLDKDIIELGYLFEDDSLKKAVRRQLPLAELYPRSLVIKGIENIAYNLENNIAYKKSENSFKSFMMKLLNKF